LPQNDVVLAHGLPAESFLDIKAGSDYVRSRGPVCLYPDYCARIREAVGCVRLFVTRRELVAARAFVAGFAVEQEAAGAGGKRAHRMGRTARGRCDG
jgi:hypothetical protein